MNRVQLIKQIRDKKTCLCVGLDTDPGKIPEFLRADKDAVFLFNQHIIDATKDICVAYKINTAFYEAQGIRGWEALEKTVQYIPDSHFTIADAKRGDIGNTSAQYAQTFFETIPFDAITISPYMGSDSVKPFLNFENKWAIILALTSNEGSMDFQKQLAGDRYLFETVLSKSMLWGNESNMMYVVGATRAEDLQAIRKIIPNHFLLVPGVGAQGGNLHEVMQFGRNDDVGLLINSSRSIIYAGSGKDFELKARSAALALQTEMKEYL